MEEKTNWWTHSKLRAHISKAYLESRQQKHYVNTGFWGRDDYFYSERMIELPFLFRNVLPPPRKVLDIGCVESIVPIQLAMLGYRVTGIDIRDYHFSHQNFRFVKDDFNAHNFKERFDVVTDVSAIEHFGLMTFSNVELDFEADRKAMRKIHGLLKPKGQLIFTAPFGVHETVGSFQRIYSGQDIKELFKGFDIITAQYFHLKGNKTIKEVDAHEASRTKYGNGTYATICINAIAK